MAVIKLTIQPDKASLESTIKTINESLNQIKGLNIKIDAGSTQATQNLAANLERASKAAMEYDRRLDDMRRAAKDLQGEFGKLQRIVGTTFNEETKQFTHAVAEFGKAGEEVRRVAIAFNDAGEAEAQLISGTEDYARATQRAAKEAAQAAREKEKADRQAAQTARELDRELEASRKQQRQTWEQFVKEQGEYEAEQHRKNAEAIRFEAEEQAKARKEKEQAAEAAVQLERQYSNLIRQIDNLKKMYPEGTFDEIETQAREARDELRNLDKATEDYAARVKASGDVYKGQQRDVANAREETNKLDKVTESFWMNIQKFARWYIGGNFVVKIVNSLREALKTMKEVDTELANIQKVTDRTDAEMQKLAKSAYSAASAYGVSAQAYLESAAEFAKAGFGDQAEELAEVAIKTQLVGDVSAEVADKFLIASNAAWKMNGNIDQLNKTLDAANIIENNFATSIEKLAAGMPIAASVAANAGMTFEETIAALGTITSVTQETGTKAATALRALILNIIGAVGEYEDGIEVTEESVKSLDGILRVYAKDAMEAAAAAGTVINPMEAIAALAKASEEGLVNQAELFEILSSLGGKLRTNQLISLVQNYGMYLDMLDKTKESAGSADREIGIMLDTWEAKTNILKNTWTEFVANFINTDAIKGGLDVAISLIELLNTDLGRTAIIAAGIPAIVMTIISALKPLYAAVLAHPILAAISAVVTAIYLAETAAKKAARAVEDIRDAATEAKNAYENLNSQIKDLESRSANLTELEKTRLAILKQEAQAAAEEAKQKAKVAYYASYSGGMVGNTWVRADAQEQARNLLQKYYELQSQLKKASSTAEMDELEKQIQETTIAITNMAEDLLDLQEILGDDLPEAGKNAIEILSLFIRGLNKVSETENKVENDTESVIDATKSLHNILQEASDAATAYDTALGAVVDAMADFGAGSAEVYDAMKNLEEAIPGSTDKLYDFDTATITAKDDIFTSKDALLDFIDTTKQLEFSQAISELENLAASYWDVAGAALAAMNAQAANQMAGVLAFTTGGSAQPSDVETQISDIKAQKAEWDLYISTLRARSGYSGGGGGSGSSASTADPELARLQNIVNLRKAELSFLEASGKSEDEINAKRKEIQAALHDQAEYMRSIGSDEADILALSTEWWNIQKQITKEIKEAGSELDRLKAIVSYEKQELSFLQASGKSLDEINAKRKEIQASLHDQAEYMRGILAAMDDTNSTEAERKAYEEDILALSTEWWNIQKQINDDLAKAEEERLKKLEEEKKLQQEMFAEIKSAVDDYYAKLISEKEEELSLEEKILAVQKAQAALANAQRERTVRYYNASTGQWEWQANAKNVKSAQDALKKAQDDLNKYQRDMAWKEFKNAWEYVAEQIKAGAMTFQEAYDYMYKEMKRIQDTYGVDLGGTLEDSIGGFKNLNYGIDGLTREVSDSLGASVGVLNEKLKQYETAVGALKGAFDEAKKRVEEGEWSMEDAFSYLRDRAKDIADKYGIDMTGALNEAIRGMDMTNMSIDELWKAVIINLMKVNSARWFDATDEEKAMLHAQNEYLGKLIGATYDPEHGYWYLNGSKLYEKQQGVAYDATGYGSSTGSGGGSGDGSGDGSGSGGYGTMHMTTTGYTKEYTDEVIGKLKEIPEGVYDPRLVPNMGTNAHKAEWALEHNAGSYKGAIYAGPLMKNAYTDPKRWTDPEAWAAYSNLKEADDEYAAKLHAIEDAIANGASEEDVIGMINDLYENGEFAAIPGEDGGLPTGWVKVGYGNANGEYVLVLGGKKIWQTGVDAGSMAQDLWGNRWEIGEDGTLTPIERAWNLGETDSSVHFDGMMDLGNSDIGMSIGGGSFTSSDIPAIDGGGYASSVTNNNQSISINGVYISEADAKRTTVYELAMLASKLGTFSTR